MATPTERISTLIEAYEWEQNRLVGWRTDATATANAMANISNPMIQRFAATWELYLEAVKKSNQHVIDLLTAANDSKEGDADAIKRAIREVNRIEHRKGSVAAISNATNAHRRQSAYFESLDDVIDLENEVRDYIEEYLTNG